MVRNKSLETPCSSATTQYIASKIIAGALIVIDVDTLSSGISAKDLAYLANMRWIHQPYQPLLR